MITGRYIAGDSETKQCWGYSGASLTQWVLTVVLGVTVGLIAFVMKQGIEEVQLLKLGYIELLLNPCTASADACAGLGEQEQRERVQPALALGVFCAVNAALALSGAALTVGAAPEAAGSGIPEVMGYLNGVHVTKIMRLRTLTVKVLGSFLAVVSGLAVGVLGPLVHIGAIVGSGLTRGHKIWRGCGGRMQYKCHVRAMERFHNDADRRDFISMGAAVGFAAAFGAPVGGVLFALEEAASFWDSKLMWRTLTATTVACFVLAVSERYVAPAVFDLHFSCAAGQNGTQAVARELFQPGMLTFQTAASFEHPWENLLCVVMGVAGGILGAAFNRMHAILSRCRAAWVQRRPAAQLAEVLCLSLLTSTVMFGLSLYGECKELNGVGTEVLPDAVLCNTSEEPWRLQWATLGELDVCGPQEYNDMATALLVGQRRVIVSMMEEPERYSARTLLCVGVAFFFLMTLTYGSSLPAGVFVPTILTGACFGSLVGIGLQRFFDHTNELGCEPGSWW